MARLVPEFVIPPKLRRRLLEHFLEIERPPEPDFQSFVIESWSRLLPLPAELVQRLLRFRAGTDGSGSLIVRGLPVDPDPPKTPVGDTPGRQEGKDSYVSEACLVSLATILGDVFSYIEEANGVLIRSLCPSGIRTIDGGAYFGSHDLPLHTEMACSPMRRYCQMLCSVFFSGGVLFLKNSINEPATSDHLMKQS